MASDRARRRAEREATEAAERETRARKQARQEKGRRRRASMRGLVPDVPNRRPGILAARKRRRLMAFVAGIVAVQVVIWPFLPSWGARLVVLGLTLVAAPVVWVLSFGRV